LWTATTRASQFSLGQFISTISKSFSRHESSGWIGRSAGDAEGKCGSAAISPSLRPVQLPAPGRLFQRASSRLKIAI